jgi:hypothetical protein
MHGKRAGSKQLKTEYGRARKTPIEGNSSCKEEKAGRFGRGEFTGDSRFVYCFYLEGLVDMFFEE